MKRGVTIGLIILVVVIIALGAYIAITYRQAKELVAVVNDNSIKQDFSELVMGDCSKLIIVETEFADVETKVMSACKNPILKFIIKKASSRDICKEVLDSDNTLKQTLTTMQNFCKSQEEI